MFSILMLTWDVRGQVYGKKKKLVLEIFVKCIMLGWCVFKRLSWKRLLESLGATRIQVRAKSMSVLVLSVRK